MSHPRREMFLSPSGLDPENLDGVSWTAEKEVHVVVVASVSFDSVTVLHPWWKIWKLYNPFWKPPCKIKNKSNCSYTKQRPQLALRCRKFANMFISMLHRVAIMSIFMQQKVVVLCVFYLKFKFLSAQPREFFTNTNLEKVDSWCKRRLCHSCRPSSRCHTHRLPNTK